MKFIVITLAALCALVRAVPNYAEIQLNDARIVTDAISSAIQDVSQNIKDAGLDPLYIEEENYAFALPVPVIFSAEATINDVRSTGLSNIVIERNNFAVLAQRLTLTVALPRVDASIGKGTGVVDSFGHNIVGEVSGNVAVNELRVAADVRVSVGIISGISIRSLDIDLTLGGIDSNLSVVVHGYDISNLVNNLIGTVLPDSITASRAEINELLELLVRQIIEDLL